MPTLRQLASNFTCVEVNDNMTLWFSYATLIAFNVDGRMVVSENCFSKTTGKHLNQLCPDHDKRYGRDEFESLYKSASRVAA